MMPGTPRELPERFGRYRIVRRLGRGGMGSVYLAEDTELARRVALKVPDFSPGEGAGARERFRHEARAAAALDHPNLCRVYDVGQVDGIDYLTMPYIEGEPLSALIEPDRPTPPDRAAALAKKLASAMDEAHRLGVVHRDLKPANVMVDRNRELVILDFGLARRSDVGDSRQTKIGSVLGTPAYMAPEMVSGRPEDSGPACDIYALGVLLFELLTGRCPFEGPPAVVLGLIRATDPPAPSSLLPDLDPGLDAICRKAMARKAEDRYPTMGAFAAALGDYLAAAGPGPESVGGESAGSGVPTRWTERLAAQFLASRGDPGGRSTSGAAVAEAGPAGVARFPWHVPLAFSAAGAVALLGLVLAFRRGVEGRHAGEMARARASETAARAGTIPGPGPDPDAAAGPAPSGGPAANDPDRSPPGAEVGDQGEGVPLLDRDDFKGWFGYSRAEEAEPAKIFQIRDGELIWWRKQGKIFQDIARSNFSLSFDYALVPGARVRRATCRLKMAGGGERVVVDGRDVREICFGLTDGRGEAVGNINLLFNDSEDTHGLAVGRKAVAVREVGEWNRVEIRNEGRLLRFILNGVEVNQAELNCTPSCNVGFGSFETEIRFRDIRIAPVKL
jgi:hypothetical protein